MHSSNLPLQSNLITATAVLLPATLWLILSGYHGLSGDSQIYAFQALARIHSQFTSDLYLQNTSQDQFTVFSSIYSWFIARLGLEQAARMLTLAFKLWFMIAAWFLVRSLSGKSAAWLALCALTIVAGSYGGSSVFQFSDQFLTARLPAEAMVVTSLALSARGHRANAIALATAALLVHPLVALPGLLVAFCFCIPKRMSVIGAVVGVVTTLCLSIAASETPLVSRLLPLMDPPWLSVVEERSQFLFLQLWTYRDWELNVRPFFYLLLASMCTHDIRVQKLCFAAGIVGACGLLVAVLAGMIGPVAFLVQGQAWRWVWIGVFIAIALLPATVIQIWQDQKCGPLCSILLIAGWTLTAVDGTVCVSLAMLIWLIRGSISARQAIVFRLAFFALVSAILIWLAVKVSRILALPGTNAASAIRSLLELRTSAVLLVAFIFWWLRRDRHLWQPLLPALVLLASCVALAPKAFEQSRQFGLKSDIDAFADWRAAIPPTSTVLVVPTRDVGSFVWFTLQRPNYLTVDQSAGVVFSRATALEVRRRSEALLPVMEPNWKIRTHLRESAIAGKNSFAPPLTTDLLQQVCADPVLGFVISSRDVGFEPMRHVGLDAWKDWNLYDCQHLRPPPEKS